MRGPDRHLLTAMSAHRNRPLILTLVVAVVVLAACSSSPSGPGGTASSPSASPPAAVSSIDKTRAMSTAVTSEIDKAANDLLTQSPDKSPGK